MKINIGTNKGNIVGFEIDKAFEDICWSDLRDAAQAKYPGCSPIGWAPSKTETEKNNDMKEAFKSTDTIL